VSDLSRSAPSAAGATPGPAALRAYLKALPKAELHLHLEGSLQPRTLLRLADQNKLRLPFSTPEQFQAHYRYRNFRDFANMLLLGVGCLRRPEDFHGAIVDLSAALALQNVRYAEVTWTPQFYLNRGFPLDAILEAMDHASQQARAASGLQLRWIPDLVRSYPKPADLVTRWASSPQARAKGVVALGLGGPEAGFPARGFAEHFRKARALGLPANPHAGEGEGPDSVRETIAELQPARIGHGVRASEDAELVESLARAALPLEVCLTSNIRLNVYPSYQAHPAKRLLDAGCVVTLNSDDPVLFQTTLTDEYLHAVVDAGFTPADIRIVILNAVRSSYMADAEKAAALQQFDDEIERAGPAPAADAALRR
jgi:adenosine deaminase